MNRGVMRYGPLPVLSSSVAILLLGGCFAYFLVLSHLSLQQPVITVVRNMKRSVSTFNPFPEKIVHLDLKGAPPKLNYYSKLFPMLKRLDVTGLLIEYEDMLPYSGQLAILKRSVAYDQEQIASILQLAKLNGLEVIPLVQTFGHLEFVLKYQRFANIRESPDVINTLCPSSDESWTVITEMLRQVRRLHPEARRIHIGADEAYTIAKDERCMRRLREELELSIDRLKLAHIARTARFAKDELGFGEVLAWNDMFDKIGDDLLSEYDLDKLVTPVIWGYAEDVTQQGYFPEGVFERYSKVFSKMMFGSAFKGANGQTQTFINITRYLANQESYVNLNRINQLYLGERMQGIVLTGWQRYLHGAPLCEILPASIPSLVAALFYLNDTTLSFDQLLHNTQGFLECQPSPVKPEPIVMGNQTYYPTVESAYMNCSFPGHELYSLIENLRFLTWKIHRVQYVNIPVETLSEELSEFELKIRKHLLVYFYEETANEFILQNILPLRAFL